jgi:hypothetical protein
LSGQASRSFGHHHYGIGLIAVFDRLVYLLNASDNDPAFAGSGFPVR